MKYLKYFETEAAHASYKTSSDYVLPNVSYVEETKDVWYEPKVLELAVAGDIAYWDGSKVKTVSQDKWDASLGTPVGVVVVPTGFAPDGKARMLSLNWASESGTSSTSASPIKWSNVTVDTSLTNHLKVPSTTKTGFTDTGYVPEMDYGYLPSDQFTDYSSSVDPLANYRSKAYKIPSPYLGDKPNPNYYGPMSSWNNTLSDFDGKGNTDVLVGLGSDYIAANAARNYKAIGAEEIEWYLPAAGELGYILPRHNKIQEALTKLAVSKLDNTYFFWSSTEYSTYNAWSVSTKFGNVDFNSKNYTYYVRPFAIID
jgi:hypothetical protein